MDHADPSHPDRDEQQEQIQQRKYYRLVYPITERPVLVLGEEGTEEEFEIIDLSEGGLKFLSRKDTEFLPYQILAGRIRFHDDQCLKVEGKVLRIEPEESAVAMMFSRKIPYKRIVKEQLHLRKKTEYF